MEEDPPPIPVLRTDSAAKKDDVAIRQVAFSLAGQAFAASLNLTGYFHQLSSHIEDTSKEAFAEFPLGLRSRRTFD